mmetsp:Transcript_3413/g.12978  ORF Transcript_3413/g.12978 Transcript_3413/m.12978 type:complete len:274 (-) Transcript_3413:1917-2738(-)
MKSEKPAVLTTPHLLSNEHGDSLLSAFFLCLYSFVNHISVHVMEPTRKMTDDFPHFWPNNALRNIKEVNENGETKTILNPHLWPSQKISLGNITYRWGVPVTSKSSSYSDYQPHFVITVSNPSPNSFLQHDSVVLLCMPLLDACPNYDPCETALFSWNQAKQEVRKMFSTSLNERILEMTFQQSFQAFVKDFHGYMAVNVTGDVHFPESFIVGIFHGTKCLAVTLFSRGAFLQLDPFKVQNAAKLKKFTLMSQAYIWLSKNLKWSPATNTGSL